MTLCVRGEEYLTVSCPCRRISSIDLYKNSAARMIGSLSEAYAHISGLSGMHASLHTSKN